VDTRPRHQAASELQPSVPEGGASSGATRGPDTPDLDAARTEAALLRDLLHDERRLRTEAEQHLAAILRTKSWRLLAPLRALYARARSSGALRSRPTASREWPALPPEPDVDRRERLLTAIGPDMSVLELGPSFAPVAPRAEGWNVCVVDHLPRAELIEKYRGHANVDVSRIEEVDVVWSDTALHEAVPVSLHGTFNACIASHVLEHVPDPLGLFRSLEKLLYRDGIVSLAIPDKRFCFDFFKPLSTAGGLLAARAQKPVRHSLQTRFEYEAYNVSSRGEISWGARHVTELRLLKSIDEAKLACDTHGTTASDPYVDCHAWHFTPSSFALAVLELGAIGELDFHIECAFPTSGSEFFVTLRRGASVPSSAQDLQARRLELLLVTLAEIREQADLVLTG
jgi:SAM-dependent methyltransferase